MITGQRRINVLGTDVKIEFRKEADDPQLEDCYGYFDASESLIVVKIPEKEKHSMGNLENCQKKTLRHEIVHAFLYESGLDWSAASVDCWATNEEMVDWFAIQTPKIFKVFKEQGMV